MTNRIAIVTGGSRGLGRSTALHLASKGVDVILTYNNQAAKAEATIAGIDKLGGRAIALQLDVGQSRSFAAFAEAVEAALARHWRRTTFDYLVNNAGISLHASFAETTEAQFDELMNIHLKGTFFLTQKLLPLMADGGRIINLSSDAARFSVPGFAAYGAMKGAVEVLTRYMALELGPRQIAVNTIAPGATETDIGGGLVRDNPEVNAAIAAQTPLGRVGLPDDIGAAIAALLSDDNRWINAQRIEVSGGIRS